MNKYYIFAVSILLSTSTFSCVCAKLGENFFDTVNQHNAKVDHGEYPVSDALTVFTGKVLSYQEAPPGVIPGSMLVEVDQLLQGKLSKKEVWIEGDTYGMQCRPAVITFPINETFVFAVNSDENQQYYISGCGTYYLQTGTV